MTALTNLVQDPETTSTLATRWAVSGVTASLVGGRLRLTAQGTPTPYVYARGVPTFHGASPGQHVAARVLVSNPYTAPVAVRLALNTYLNGASKGLATGSTVTVTYLAPGESAVVENRGVMPASTNQVLPILYMYGPGGVSAVPAGQIVDTTDWSLFVLAAPAPSPVPYFHGSIPDDLAWPGYEYHWVGTPNASASVRTPLPEPPATDGHPPTGAGMDLRVVAYAPNGDSLGVLAAPESVEASAVYSDLGAIQLQYSRLAPRAHLLEGPVELAVEVTADEGTTWSEIDGGRYLALRDEGDPLTRPGMLSASGPSWVWRLEKARLLPNGTENNDGKRAFLSSTAGAILRALVDEAQARGALEGVEAGSFTATHDSAGQPWATDLTIYYQPGMDLLAILLNLADQGIVEFTTRGRALLVYNAGTALSGTPGVTLRQGRDLTAAPYVGTREGLVDYVYLQGDEGASLERLNPEAEAPWGRWEGYITQGGVRDPGTMTVLSDAALEAGSQRRVENTYALLFSRAKHLPFRDYWPGQFVGTSIGGALPDTVRCRQVTLTRDANGVLTGNTVLNDRFLEAEVAAARRVQGIVNGAQSSGGTSAPPTPPPAVGNDGLAPAAPGQPDVSTESYLNALGDAAVRVTITWPPPTENADGSALDDLAGYEVEWREDSDTAPWQHLGPSTTATLVASPFPPNTWLRFRVTALDESGNRSDPSPATRALTEADSTVPDQPSAPAVSSYLGQLLVTWDGLNAQGGGMPTDWRGVLVHVSTVSQFVPSPATLRDTIDTPGGGRAIVSGLPYGTPHYVRLVSVDRSGNASPASVQTVGVPIRVTQEDLGEGSVTRTKIELLAVDDARIASASVGKLVAGTLTADVLLSARIRTADTGARVELNSLGLRAYNSSGVETVAVRTDGTAKFSGLVEGSDVIGSSFRTATSGRRIAIDTLGGGEYGRSTVAFHSGKTWEIAPAVLTVRTDDVGDNYVGMGLSAPSVTHDSTGLATGQATLNLTSHRSGVFNHPRTEASLMAQLVWLAGRKANGAPGSTFLRAEQDPSGLVGTRLAVETTEINLDSASGVRFSENGTRLRRLRFGQFAATTGIAPNAGHEATVSHGLGLGIVPVAVFVLGTSSRVQMFTSDYTAIGFTISAYTVAGAAVPSGTALGGSFLALY